MAVTTDELLVKITIQGAETTAELSKLNSELERFKKTSSAGEKGSLSFADTFTKMNLGIFSFIQNIKSGISAVEAFVKPFMDGADATARLGFALKQVGEKDIEGFQDKIAALGDEMKRLGITSDDSIKSLAAIAVASGRSSKDIENMVKAAAGIATIKPDTSFEEAFNALQQSFKGNGAALAKLAPELQNMTKEALQAGDAVTYLKAKFGDFAEKNLDTYSGKLKAASFAFGAITEETGKAIGELIGLPRIIDASTVAFYAMAESVKEVSKFLKSDDFAIFAASMGVATLAVIAFNSSLHAGAAYAFTKGLIAIQAAATKALIPLAGFIGVVAGLATVAAITDVVAKNFFTLGNIIKSGLAAAMDYVVLAINRTIAWVIRLAGTLEDKLGNLPVFKEFFAASKKNLDSLDKAAVKLGTSIDKNVGGALEGIANIDTGLFGKGSDLLDKFMLAGIEVSKVKEKAKDVKLPNLFSDDARKAIEELKKALEDAQKAAASAGLQGVAKIQAEATQAQRSIDELAKRIGQGGKLPPEYEAQIIKLRQLSKEAFDKQTVEAFGKAINDLEKETIGLEQAYNEQTMLTLDRIDSQLTAQMKIIDLKRQELDLQGLLTGEAEDYLAKQEALAKATAAKAQKSAPGREFEGMQKAGKDIIDGISGALTSGAAGLVGGALSVAGAFASAANAFLDFIPNLVNSFTDIFNKITDFPKMLFTVFQGLFDAIIRLVAEFIPNLIASIGKSLQQIGNFVTGLIKAVVNLFKSLPAMIKDLVNQLPKLITDIVQGIIEALPDLIIAFVEFFVASLPKIIVQLAYAFAVTIPIAIVKGVLKAFETIWKRIWAALRGVKLPKIAIDTKSLDKAIKKLSGNASKLFGVTDMMEAVKDPNKAAEKIAKNVENAFAKGVAAIKAAWLWVYEKILLPIFDIVTKAWRWVWDNVLGPFFNALREVWLFIYNGVIKPLIDGIKAVWLFVWNNIIKPIITSFQTVFNLFAQIGNAIIGLFSNMWNGVTAIFQPIIDLFRGVFNSVTTIFMPIINLFKDAFDGISGFFTGIGNAFKSLFSFDLSGFSKAIGEIFTNAGEIFTKLFKGIFNPIITLLNNLKIPSIDVGFKVAGKKFGFTIPGVDFIPGDIQKLATGGLVGDGGLNLPGFGTDRTPAMLTPGEFVISKKGVEAAGLGMLQGINKGKIMGSGGDNYVVNINVTIDAKTNIDPAYIKGTLVPNIREELKRASLDGQFVLSTKGIR